MAITTRKITTYVTNVKDLSDTPSKDGMTADDLKAFFDGRSDEEIKASINGIVDDLVSAADGSSGADQVGATALKVGGAVTVQAQLKELKIDKVETSAFDTHKASTDHDSHIATLHYTKTNMQTSGQSQVAWGNLINVPNLADNSWKASVATPADLPISGNTLGDQRTVLNDGDGKQAVYSCVATSGDWNTQWDKIADVDYMVGEANREAAEIARAAAEGDRVTAEGLRVTAESTRVDAENTRLSNETNRGNAEGLRVTAESNRVNAEGGRVTAENLRTGTETARQYIGVYEGATAYSVGNQVTYDGSTYRCITASTGNLPTNATYWILIAAKGTDGEMVTVENVLTSTSTVNALSAKMGKDLNDIVSTHSAKNVHELKIGITAISDDLNQCLTSGIYHYSPTTQNSPSGGYGVVESVVSAGATQDNLSNWIFQRAYQVNSLERMWTRQKVNDGAWTLWQLVISESININYNSDVLEKMRAGQSVKIVTFGDSITQGYLTTTPYPTLLQADLRLCFNNSNISVVNTAIGGYTSSDGVSHFKADVIDQIPDMAILMFGMNDLTGGSITAETFRNNLQVMIWECKKNHIAPVIMTATPCMTDSKTKLQIPYIKACFEICEKENVPCLDLYGDFYDAFQSRYFSTKIISDKIHVGDAGTALIKNKIQTDIFDVPLVTKTTDFPVSGSKYGSTDIATHYTDANLYYGETLILNKNGANGLFYRMMFFVKSTSATVKINILKYNACGTYNVSLDGADTAVNGYDAGLVLETFVTLGVVGYGMHTVEVRYDGWVSGGDVFQFNSIKVEI